jgi:hypothetical protein
MSLKTEDTTIDGIVFSTTQFGAMAALELMGRLAQTIGPAVGVLSAANPDTPVDQLAPVIASAMQNLKPNELGALAMAVLANTSATINDNGTLRRLDILTTQDFNKVFSGKLMTMFKAIVHALKVNYSDFGFGSAPASAPTTAVATKE